MYFLTLAYKTTIFSFSGIENLVGNLNKDLLRGILRVK